MSNYELLSSHENVELVGAIDTRDVVQVQVRTVPSGISFPLRIPDSAFSDQAARALAEQYSAILERWVAEPTIAGIRYEQNVNAAGDLVDEFVFVVQSANGQFTREVSQPLIALILGNIDPIIQPIADELTRLES